MDRRFNVRNGRKDIYGEVYACVIVEERKEKEFEVQFCLLFCYLGKKNAETCPLAAPDCGSVKGDEEEEEEEEEGSSLRLERRSVSILPFEKLPILRSPLWSVSTISLLFLLQFFRSKKQKAKNSKQKRYIVSAPTSFVMIGQ